MHLSEISVQGFRAAVDTGLTVNIPGRFSVVIGANSAGKTTFCDSALLAHTSVFPRSPRLDAAALGERPRSVSAKYSFDKEPDAEGPLGRMLQAQSGRIEPGGVAGE